MVSKEIQLRKGQLCQVEITGSDEFDFYGKFISVEDQFKLLMVR